MTDRSTTSNMSMASTFRDTQCDQEDANNLMHMQSLTSIVNNPKKESFFNKVKNNIKSKLTIKSAEKYDFKPMTEAMVEDSLSIPKVSAKKDFKDYFKSLEKSEVGVY